MSDEITDEEFAAAGFGESETAAFVNQRFGFHGKYTSTEVRRKLAQFERERNEARRIAEEAMAMLDENGFQVNGVPWEDDDDQRDRKIIAARRNQPERPAEKVFELAARDTADAARFRWLLKQGLAWQGCYEEDDVWQEGEWLYECQDARAVIDEAMESREAETNENGRNE